MIALQAIPDSLDAALARAQAAAHNAAALWLSAVVAHIGELADAAQAMQTEAAHHAGEVPGHPDLPDSLGEGGESLELVGWAAMDAQRYAAEAAYWLAAYRAAQARIAEGKPALTWDSYPCQEQARLAVDLTRERMRRANTPTPVER